MKTPKVSVICACYNQSQYIIESLESVKSQTFQDFEIIIWDDASKDNSVAIIESWIAQNPEYSINFIKHEKNWGICKSLNHAYLKSKGEYIQILALDDILMPDKLEKHVAILDASNENQALVFSDTLMIDNDGALLDKQFIPFHTGNLKLKTGNYFEALVKQNFIPGMAVLFKRSAIDRVGLFDESLVFEDYDMWLRMARQFDFIYDEQPSAKYRYHDNNTHKKLSQQMYISTLAMLIKHIDQPQMKQRIKAQIDSMYLNQCLNGEEAKYFAQYPPQNMLDRMIKNGSSVFLYRVVRKLSSILGRSVE